MADSNIKMVSPITAETFQQLVFNAGMVLHDFDFSSAMHAGDLMALAMAEKAQKESWMGATDGGVNVQENRTYWEPGMDGKRLPFKGEKQFDTAKPKMTGTLLQHTPETVRKISGSAVITEEGDYVTKVQPTATIKPGDYMDNVVFIGNVGSDGLYLVEMKNVLCTSGMNWQTRDKGVATMPFEFSAHSDSPTFTDELPVSYWFYGVATD